MNPRTLSRVSVGAAILMLLTAPLHAVAYLRTPDGEPGLLYWHDWAFDTAPGLWGWGPPQNVYLAYGRITSVLLVLALSGIVALHQRQKEAGAGFEQWTFRLFAVAYALLSVGALMEYYTPFLDQAFMFIALPGAGLTLVSGLLYGIASMGREVITKGLALFLGLSFLPGVPLMVAVFGHIPIGFSLVMIALILVGRRNL